MVPDWISLIDIAFAGVALLFGLGGFQKGFAEQVAHIITFGSMKSRAAIRDVGRVLDIPLYEVDRIAKLIPSDSKSLDDALDKEPALREMIASNWF